MSDYLPSIFQGMTRQEIDDALEVFKTVDVDTGDVVIEEGEYDPTLAVVHAGELGVTTGGTLLGRAGTGDIVGEMALFGTGLRSATVTAAQPSTLLVLDQEGYERLRYSGNRITAAIEERCLHALTDRLRLVGDRIASIAHGKEQQDVTPAPGFFDRVATAFGSGGIVAPGRMDGGSVLKGSALFAGVPDEVLSAVAAEFFPIGARTGHFLCTEGETGNDMFLIASGEVDVVVATANDRVEQLATLGPGDAFGMCALLQPENPRMASCVARTRVTALSMGRLTFAELIPRSDAVGSVLRVAMIRAMADQLAYANAQLAVLDMKRQSRERVDRDYEALMRAAAALETHGEYLGGEGSSLQYLYERG